MMGVNTRNMWSCLQKCNKLNTSHLVGKLLNSIQDARTHVHKIYSLLSLICLFNMAYPVVAYHFINITYHVL